MSHDIVVDISIVCDSYTKYFLSSYRFICYCVLPSVYLVKGKDIKRYLCFQILCSRFYFITAHN